MRIKIGVLSVCFWFVVALLGWGVAEQLVGPKYYTLCVSSGNPIDVYNLSKHGTFFHSGAFSTDSTALMAEAGDFLYIGIEECDVHSLADLRSLDFAFEEETPSVALLQKIAQAKSTIGLNQSKICLHCIRLKTSNSSLCTTDSTENRSMSNCKKPSPTRKL